jgi:hypothetical protein
VLSITWISAPDGTSKWKAQFTVTISSPSGLVAGAVVTGSATVGTGSPTVKTCTTASNGRCVLNFGGIAKSKPSLTMTVTKVTASPAWDGVQASATATKPAGL